MKTFNCDMSYLKELKKKKKLAILPLSAASKLLLRKEGTVKGWITTGRLAGVKIENDVYPLASAVHARVAQRDKEVKALYKTAKPISRCT